MNEIVRQQRLKMAAEDQGETARILAVASAEAEGQKIRIQAAADAEAKFLNGEGMARQRAAIINGMRDDVSHFSNVVDDVGARDVLHLIILTQYLDTLRDVAHKSSGNSMFVPHGPGSVTALSEQIRQGFEDASKRT
uniref:Uncharacterized protein n=1 Tax=Spongospora subterranea TaxID=70186 RepID=A0A0H5RBW8_9EUKA|eukprot:CRZ11523.1 hypothetical protein [Spongospora subterranea]